MRHVRGARTEAPTEAVSGKVGKGEGPLLGRPRVSLPLSQLVLGRTAPPWHAEAWRHLECAVVKDDALGDVLRVWLAQGPLGGCRFVAVPRGMPASDLTLTYSVRFSTCCGFGGGRLPGLSTDEGVRIGPAWDRDGRVSLRVGDAVHPLDLDPLHTTGWNEVALRVKLNSFAPDAPRRDALLTVSVNGRPATVDGLVLRRGARTLLSSVDVSCSNRRSGSNAAGHVDLAGFALVA